MVIVVVYGRKKSVPENRNLLRNFYPKCTIWAICVGFGPLGVAQNIFRVSKLTFRNIAIPREVMEKGPFVA